MEIIAEDVNTAAATTAVDLNDTNFGGGRGRQAVLAVVPSANANQVGNVEVSDDGTAWSTLQAYTAADPLLKIVSLMRYIRVNNTSGTTGETSFYLLDA